MLKRLYVDNYKCLVNFEVSFSELSLLLGPNGVGKTSVLDVVFALHELLSGTVKVTDPAIFQTRTLTRWQKRDAQVFEVRNPQEPVRNPSPPTVFIERIRQIGRILPEVGNFRAFSAERV